MATGGIGTLSGTVFTKGHKPVITKRQERTKEVGEILYFLCSG